MIRKYIVPLLALAGLVIAIGMVFRGNRPAPTAEPSVQPSQAPYPSYIFGPGIVEASTENISIGTPVSGIVSDIYVKWGDRVKAGDPLFKIDSRDLEAQLIPANAHVNEVEAQTEAANAKVNEAQQTLAKAENHLKIGEGLEVGVSISAEELANRRFDVDAAKASLASAQAQVGQIPAQVATAKAQVEQIEREIELRTVRAPISARILQLKTRVGEYAQSGAVNPPLMVLGDDKTLHVRVDIDETDAWRFETCAAAVASVRGNPTIKTALKYVRTDPEVVPKTLLTGDATQRTDTRVLQVIYSFDPRSLPLYVGQLMDVFIQAPPPTAAHGTSICTEQDKSGETGNRSAH